MLEDVPLQTIVLGSLHQRKAQAQIFWTSSSHIEGRSSAYKLDLPKIAAIHVSLLKKALGETKISQPLPTILFKDMEWIVEPVEVVDTC